MPRLVIRAILPAFVGAFALSFGAVEIHLMGRALLVGPGLGHRTVLFLSIFVGLYLVTVRTQALISLRVGDDDPHILGSKMLYSAFAFLVPVVIHVVNFEDAIVRISAPCAFRAEERQQRQSTLKIVSTNRSRERHERTLRHA